MVCVWRGHWRNPKGVCDVTGAYAFRKLSLGVKMGTPVHMYARTLLYVRMCVLHGNHRVGKLSIWEKCMS